MTEIVIPAGPIPSDGSDCVNVTAINDDLLEGNHNFDIRITSTDLSNVLVGTPDTITITITDESGMNTNSSSPHAHYVHTVMHNPKFVFSTCRCNSHIDQ